MSGINGISGDGFYGEINLNGDNDVPIIIKAPKQKEETEEVRPKEQDVEFVKSPELKQAEALLALGLSAEETIQRLHTDPIILSIVATLNPAVAEEIERQRKVEAGED